MEMKYKDFTVSGTEIELIRFYKLINSKKRTEYISDNDNEIILPHKKKGGRGPAWRRSEIRILKNNAEMGMIRLLRLLPGRNKAAIRAKGYKLNLVIPKRAFRNE